MHEMSIAEGIIEIVERTARSNGIQRVKTVHAAVGELAGVDVDALLFAWESVRRGGPAADAPLVIDRPAGKAWCMHCGKTVPLHRFGDPCPTCGGYQLEPTDGLQMRVTDITTED